MDFLGGLVNSTLDAADLGSSSTSPAEKQLRPILCDEQIKVLSTFELNQVASLTYNDVTCDGIFEFLQKLCSRPLDTTTLTLHKALIVTKHVLIYGSEKTVNHAYGMQGILQPLLEYNTVLMTQQQGGAMSFMQRMQGGAVDKGGPVREATSQVLQLLSNVNHLRQLRLQSASEDSLVPVGDNAQVGFVTDDARLVILQRKMAEEKRVRIQSNLKKSEGGFGGGYASKDGRSVVGAAHGIEEMIKMANKHASKTGKFSDDGLPPQKTQEEIILEELKAEADAEKAKEAARHASADLLGTSNAPAAAYSGGGGVDLLDFGGGTSSSSGAVTGNLLGGGLGSSTPSQAADPFGLASAYSNNTTIPHPGAPASSSLLDFSVQNDPFAPPTTAPPTSSSLNNDPTGLMSMGMTMNNNNTSTMMNNLASGMNSVSLSSGMPPPPMPSAPPPTPAAPRPMAMANSNQDRFSALDALAASTPVNTIPSAQEAKDAEARLMGGMPSMSSGSSSMPPPSNGMSSMGMGMTTTTGYSIPEPMVAPGSGQVATAYGDAGASANDDGDNPWVMGGSTGMGLEPVGPQPSAPPPPPPPSY